MSAKKQQTTDTDIRYELLSNQTKDLYEKLNETNKDITSNKEELHKDITDLKDIMCKRISDKAKEIEKEFEDFKEDKFRPLEKKTDNISWKLGLIVTILITVGVMVVKTITTDTMTAIKKYKNIQLMEEFDNAKFKSSCVDKTNKK